LASLVPSPDELSAKDAGNYSNFQFRVVPEINIEKISTPLVFASILWCSVVDLALLTGAVKVISAKLSRCGSPLVVLASRHAFLYDMSMKCWLRVADDCFPASNFASSFISAQGGELGKLQIDIGKFMARKPIWSRSACTIDFFSMTRTPQTIPMACWVPEFALNVSLCVFLFQGYRWWIANTRPFGDSAGSLFGFEVTTGVPTMPPVVHKIFS
jgi:hypothetical protein